MNRAPKGDFDNPTFAGKSTEFKVVRHAGQMPTDLIPMPWTAVGVRKASTEIAVAWTFGSCGDKDFHVYLDETTERVIVDVWNDPSFSGACDAMGHFGGTVVKLAQPLGDRPLVKHRIEPSLE